MGLEPTNSLIDNQVQWPLCYYRVKWKRSRELNPEKVAYETPWETFLPATNWCKQLDSNQQTSNEDQFYRLPQLTVSALLAWRIAMEFNHHPFQELPFSRRFAERQQRNPKIDGLAWVA